MNAPREPGRGGERRRYSPLWQLTLARVREFWREPEAIFWVYGFPILMVIALGIAFRSRPVEQLAVDVIAGPAAAGAAAALRRAHASGPRGPDGRPGSVRFAVRISSAAAAQQRLRTGKTDLVLALAEGGAGAAHQYTYDATRSEGRLARALVDDVLQRAAGRRDVARILPDRAQDQPGGRYIDFLIPGLLGMSLMGGGMWGVGYVAVDMRIRKLLKRFVATPMRRSHFLGALMLSRLLFMIPELLALLVFARVFFGVVTHGSLLAVVGLIVLGAFTFAGIGLLVASRARTVETVSGLINLVMMPMWILSGIFFSAERFPAPMQPAIQLLPLTALNDALRAVMLEGASLATQLGELANLAGWGVVCFALALRWFRWG